MRLAVSTHLKASPEMIWDTVKKKELLFYVIKPMAKFTMNNEKDFGYWQQNKRYIGKSYVLSFIPIGEREIFLERIDDQAREIQSREKGEIGLKKWDHLISVAPEGDGVRYTDTIDIDAGILTLFYWLFACVFYKHRQRRWRKLLKISDIKQSLNG